MTYVPFGGNDPEAMPRVVARNVDPLDSVPKTEIILLGSIDFREPGAGGRIPLNVGAIAALSLTKMRRH